MTFFAPDTNLLVYMFDRRDPVKQNTALQVFHHLRETDRCVLLLQSLGEFISVATRKLGMDAEAAGRIAENFLEVFETSAYTRGDLRIACKLMSDGRFSFWDGVMLATAVSSGCDIFISEDMQSGSRVGTLQIISPFAPDGSHNPQLMDFFEK
jgi:predicted nucleic acid-binding protein